MSDTDDADTVLELCWGCRNPFRRRKGRKEHYCPSCSGDFAREGVEQMEAKAGPVYEKAVIASYNYWLAEAERLDLIATTRPGR